MDLNDIEKLYLSRRSCRNYEPEKKIDAETLKRIVTLATLAPSACNSQPWKIYAANKTETVRAIAAATHKMGLNKFTDNCAAFAVITASKPNLTERVGQKFTGNEFVSNDIGIMCAHLVLAAEAAGVSSCILGMFDEGEIKKILSVPDGNKVALVVALGYAAEDDVPKEKKRKPSSETAEFILE